MSGTYKMRLRHLAPGDLFFPLYFEEGPCIYIGLKPGSDDTHLILLSSGDITIRWGGNVVRLLNRATEAQDG